jgi:hypothetical protein
MPNIEDMQGKNRFGRPGNVDKQRPLGYDRTVNNGHKD